MKNKKALANDVSLEQDLFPIYKPLPPFIKFPFGYGYYGVILQSSRNGKIQCHLCGQLFKSVGRHVTHKHDMTIEKYREFVGLNAYTPLVCESTSMKIRESYTNLPKREKAKRLKTLHKNNRKAHFKSFFGGLFSKKRHVTGSKKGAKRRVQMQNKFGTCDLQAKHYFWEEYKKLGRIPMGDEMSGKLKYLIYSRFSSYDEALKTWGVNGTEIHARKTLAIENANKSRTESFAERTKQDKDTFMLSVHDFYAKKGRLPTWEEARRRGYPHRSVWYRFFGTTKKTEMLEIVKNYTKEVIN